MSTLDRILDIWDEGEHHGFPPCCRARFIVSVIRPKLLRSLLPGVGTRLRQLSPRMALADGMVPCEYHLAKWVLQGTREGWRAPLEKGMCCETRSDLERSGVAVIQKVTYEPDPEDEMEVLSEVATFWMLTFQGEVEEGISVAHCPWCGSEL